MALEKILNWIENLNGIGKILNRIEKILNRIENF